MFMTDLEFHTAARDGAAPADALLRKQFPAVVRAAGEDGRILDFTISTGSVDRMGDTIAVDGWKLENYRKNPVVLWAHFSSLLPIAKAVDVRIEGKKLKARAEFMPADMSPFADSVYRALKAGYLSGCSVGFLPLKYVFVDDPERGFGIDFIEQELLEFSVVPVPANASALVEGRAEEAQRLRLVAPGAGRSSTPVLDEMRARAAKLRGGGRTGHAPPASSLVDLRSRVETLRTGGPRHAPPASSLVDLRRRADALRASAR